MQIIMRGLNGLTHPYFDAQIWGLTIGPSAVFMSEINLRVDLMFEQGLVEEVQALIESGLSENCTAGQAIGYKEFFAYFAGEQSLEQTRELIKQHTRQYAKRQISWLKRDGRVRWLDMDRLTPEDALELIFVQHADVQCQ